VKGEGVVKRRLFDMGITPGTLITLKKTAPLGDPLELRLRGYALSIRQNEARSVVMRPGVD
jgi:Fe2+ transport system protein FeoA